MPEYNDRASKYANFPLDEYKRAYLLSVLRSNSLARPIIMARKPLGVLDSLTEISKKTFVIGRRGIDESTGFKFGMFTNFLDEKLSLQQSSILLLVKGLVRKPALLRVYGDAISDSSVSFPLEGDVSKIFPRIIGLADQRNIEILGHIVPEPKGLFPTLPPAQH